METKNLDQRIDYEKEDIIKLIENKEYKKLKEYLIDTNDIDVAEIINDIKNPLNKLLIFRMLPKKSASVVFAYLDKRNQLGLLDNIGEDEIKLIMKELFFDDIIDLIEEMPAESVDKILQNISDVERSLVNQFLMYKEDSAGSLMTIEYVSFNQNMTVSDALKKLHDVGLTKETIYTCYVVDNNHRLLGLISLKDLVMAGADEKIGNIMEEDVIFLGTEDDQEEAAELFSRYDFIAMPVVDRTHRLVGIVTFDDIMRVMDRENTEDFHKMAGVTPTEDEYLDTGTWNLAKSRLPWLLFLLLSATFTGLIIRNNLDVLSAFAVLSTLMTMLSDTGGNAASQSSTLVIRGLATGDIDIKDSMKILFKELKVSAIISVVLVFVIAFRIMVLQHQTFSTSLTVILTLIFTVFASNLIGGLLPVTAKKLGLDPAIMAVPLITTIVDACSLMIYFRVARIILM